MIDQAAEIVEIAPGICRITGFFPQQIQAIQTTRLGGDSKPPYNEFNLGAHVGDDPVAVLANRKRLQQVVQAELVWLDQVHGTRVLAHASGQTAPNDCRADAIVANQSGQACLVMTADCLPLLIARPGQQQIAAVHAGWRGLCDGVIEATLDRLAAECPRPVGRDEWWIWLGPAIGPEAFQVGEDVRAAFLANDPAMGVAFQAQPSSPGKWLADLGLLARLRLSRWFEAFRGGAAGHQSGDGPVLIHVAQQKDCVYTQADRYFSYRRDRVTGRMASLISLI